jgi:hypothetical protein
MELRKTRESGRDLYTRRTTPTKEEPRPPSKSVSSKEESLIAASIERKLPVEKENMHPRKEAREKEALKVKVNYGQDAEKKSHTTLDLQKKKHIVGSVARKTLAIDLD